MTRLDLSQVTPIVSGAMARRLSRLVRARLTYLDARFKQCDDQDIRKNLQDATVNLFTSG